MRSKKKGEKLEVRSEKGGQDESFSVQNSQCLIPRLRFPEFQNTGEWRPAKLAELSSTGLSNGVFNDPKKVGAGYKLINVSEMYIETTIVESRLSLLELSEAEFLANKVIDGDIFFTRSSLVKSGIAASNIYLGNAQDITFDGHLIRFRPDRSQVWPLFAHYLLKSGPVRTQLISRGKSATMTTIGQADVAATSLCVPQHAEQQKIAECLSSIDEAIAAQARKLDALKTHKKGLMQQLFPREGETQPRLRFPEFQDAGEWEVKKLEDLAQRGSGHTPNKAYPEYYNGGIKWVSLADSRRLDSGLISETQITISEEGIKNSSAVIHPAGTVLISRDAGVGKSAIMDSPMAVSQHFIVWRCNSRKLSNWFLYYVLQNMKPLLEDVATGSTIKTIGLPFFKELQVTVPSPVEQQRIATCLTTLDDLITAETQKHETLKTHKRGLMQQLFPVENCELRSEKG